MRYYITNPKDGSDIKVGELALKVGDTKEYKKAHAEYLSRTFGFLTLEIKKGKEFEKEAKKVAKKTVKKVEKKKK